MKTLSKIALLRVAVASFGLLLLSACASTQKTAYGDAPPQTRESVVADERYVAMVENIAKQRGTRVMWVNIPRKRVVEPVATTR